jgi:hypothetical protein
MVTYSMTVGLIFSKVFNHLATKGLVRNLFVFRTIATSRELVLLEKEKRLGRIERI